MERRMNKKPDLLTRVKDLQQHCTQEEKAELTAFYNARQRTLTAYNEDSTAARKKDYDAAREGLTELVERLEQQYLAPEPQTSRPAYHPTDILFRNSTEMYHHLKDKGWDLSSRQTLTNHAKKGSLQLAPDRSITTAAFEAWKNHPEGGQRYYESYIRHQRDALGTIEENALKKSKDEAEIIALNRRKKEREEQKEMGLLITREQADAEVCAWTGITRDTIAAHIIKQVPTIIHTTGGQIQTQPELEALIEQTIDAACNAIATSDEVDVVIEGEPEEDTEEMDETA
jgi:hypothetical protein